MNEIVKYANQLNTMGFGSLSPNQQNILFALFTLFKESESNELTIPLNEILELANIDKRSNTEYISDLFSKFKDLQAFVFKYAKEDKQGDKTYYQANIFPIVSVNTNKDILKVKINAEFKRMYVAVYKNFTRFQLAEFTEIPSTYAKTIYRCLKQFRNTGMWEIKWNDFLELLEIPESYKAGNIDQQILKPTLKYLSEPRLFDPERVPFKGLKFTKKKKGKFIDKIIFTFEKPPKSNAEKVIESLSQEHKKKLDNLEKTIKSIKNIYLDKWLKFNPPKEKGEQQRFGLIKDIYLEKEKEIIRFEIAIYYKKPALINSNFVEIIKPRFKEVNELIAYINKFLAY